MSDDLDMINRDPNNINDHVKVAFDDIIGEPEGVHSIDCAWRNAHFCFTCCQGCCYKLITAICGVPMGCYWGVQFALIAIQHIWCVTPCLRGYMINCGCLQKFYSTLLNCFVLPCCEAFGAIFSQIRISKVSS